MMGRRSPLRRPGLLVVVVCATLGGWPVARASAEGEGSEQVRALLSAGVDRARHGELAAALEMVTAALERFRALGDGRGEGDALIELAFVHWLGGDSERALAIGALGLERRRALGDVAGQAQALNNLGLVDQSLGRLDAARERYAAALPLARQAAAASLEASILKNLGGLHLQRGEPRAALELFEQALAPQQAAGEDEKVARTFNNLGAAHRALGAYPSALDAYARALEIQRRLGDVRGQAASLNNVGFLYLKLGETERARGYFLDSLPLRRSVGDRRGEATALNNLGLAAFGLERLDEAESYLRQALELRRALGDRRAEATTLDHLGTLERRLGHTERARASLERALELRRAVGDARAALSLRQLGELDLERGEVASALARLDAAVELHRHSGDRDGEIETLDVRAAAQRRAGRLAEARRDLETAVEQVEALRLAVNGPDLRAAFFALQRAAHEHLIDLLMELERREPGAGHARAALEVAERARARSLLDVLHAAEAGPRRDLDPERVERRLALLERLAALRDLERRRLESESADAEHGAEIRLILAELDRLETELAARRPELAELVRAQTLGAGEIRTLIDPGTLLLEIALGEERSFLWAVGADTFETFELPPRRELEALARRLWERWSVLEVGAGAGDELALARRAAEQILGPILRRSDLAHGLARLAIVADGALVYLPFAALPVPGGKPGERLVDRWEITYLPSASALAALRRAALRAPAPRPLAVVADPVFGAALPRLPGSAREAERLAALLPAGETWLATGFEASRRQLLAHRLGEYRFLHFATHGLLDSEHPELSSLALARLDPAGRPQAGDLRLADIHALELEADLVVLSGCRTALGRQLRGEGLLGLARGFLAAGAARVAASLWRVEDQPTAELMERFYRRMLHDGQSPAAALGAAQRELRAKTPWKAPYYWAAFIIQGDWRWR